VTRSPAESTLRMQLGDLDEEGEASGRRLARRPVFWLRMAVLAAMAGLLAAGLALHFRHSLLAGPAWSQAHGWQWLPEAQCGTGAEHA